MKKIINTENEIQILETILKKNITAFEDRKIHDGFQFVTGRSTQYNQHVILKSVVTNKFYKFYIKYDTQGKAYLSDNENIVEVEQKQRIETIVYYEEIK